MKTWRANGAAIAAAGLAAAGCTGVALAANQVKGATYTGALIPATKKVTVNFKVASNGKRVMGLTISNTPLYCEGGGPATPVRFANATISSSGAFTSTGRYVIAVGPLKGQVGTKLKISGKFLPGGREQGVLTTTYPKTPRCGGKSSYATKRV